MSETFSSSLRPALPSPRTRRRVQELGDVPSQADRKSDIEAGEGAFDVRDAVEVAGIVRQDLDGRSVALERHPMILFQIVDIEVSQQFDIDEGALAVFDVGTLVKLRDGPADLHLGHFVLFDQNAFEVRGNAFACLGDGVVELVLSDFAVGHEQVELGRGFLRGDLLEIEEGNAQRLGDLGDRLLVLPCETESAFLVEELQHAHKVLIVGDDRIRQDLLGLESRALVVGSIMIERRMDALQFRRVIGVRNVHGPQVFGAEAGQALLGDRDADLLDRIDVGDLIEDFLLVGVKGEEGEVLGIKEAQNILVQVEKDLV